MPQGESFWNLYRLIPVKENNGFWMKGEKSMKFITCSKKVRDMASKILKYQNVISEMIYADISDELFRKGEIIIPETLLYHEISKYMAKEDPGVTIYSLVCEDNHIDMAVAINRKWGGFGFDVRLSIRDVEVSKNRQVISFHAEFRKVAYNNVVERLSGKMTGVDDCVLDFIWFEAAHKQGQLSILSVFLDKDKMMQSISLSQFAYFILQNDCVRNCS